jgi:hypothetical protein
MAKSPFEKITSLNAPNVIGPKPMPIESGFNDDSGYRIELPGGVPKPKPGKPGKPIIVKPKPTPKPIPGKPKPGKPGDNFEGPLPGPRLPGGVMPIRPRPKPEPGKKYIQ